MESGDPERQQLGVATYLIDKLALRVGNEKDENEADTVGCCSLRIEHITLGKFTDEDGNEVGGENSVTFDFLGKDSMRYLNTVTVEPLVYQLIKKFNYKLGLGSPITKDSKEEIFDLINASRLNEHLKVHMPDLTAKVFRTYNASITL